MRQKNPNFSVRSDERFTLPRYAPGNSMACRRPHARQPRQTVMIAALQQPQWATVRRLDAKSFHARPAWPSLHRLPEGMGSGTNVVARGRARSKPEPQSTDA
jgi:hypothetical protein